MSLFIVNFESQCVDEWLRVNASCPTCRKRIAVEQGPTGESIDGSAHDGDAPTATTSLLRSGGSSNSSGRGSSSSGEVALMNLRGGSSSGNNSRHAALVDISLV